MTGLPLLCPYFIAISVPSNLPIDWHSFRRVEVPSGTPRPRRWSAAEKAAIVAESPAPGSQTIEIALRYGLHRNQLYGSLWGVSAAGIGLFIILHPPAQ